MAAVGRTGTLAFRVAYDAYGEARHLPAKDINGDGKVDSADTAIAQAASGKRLGQPGKATAVGTPRPKCRAARGPQEAEASAYPQRYAELNATTRTAMPRGTAPGGTADVAANPDADWDRDGKITSADVAQFGSRSYVAALPQGQLAPAASVASPLSPANARSDFNIGFSGYRFNGDIGAYTVRFRHYDPTPGMCRWLERDPAGYQDGPSLYSYLGRSPVDAMDPTGLVSRHAFPARHMDRHAREDFLRHNGISRFEDQRMRNGRHEVQPAVRSGREGWYLRRYNDDGHLVESRWVASDILKLPCHPDWYVGLDEAGVQRAVAGALLNSFVEQVADNIDTSAKVAGTAVLLAVPGPEDLIIVGALAKLARAEGIAARGARSHLVDPGKGVLPALDSTGKVHGRLPRVEDLGRYDPDELRQLSKELQESVQERIRKTTKLGRDKGHGARQAAEQQLIKAIERHLQQYGN